jgi:hypothetical protein
MERVDYQLRLELDLGEEFEPEEKVYLDAPMRDEIARKFFDGLENKPEWYEEYMRLIEGGWPWRVACYMAWAGSPRRERWPETTEKLATEVLGLTGPRVIYQWRKRNPAIDQMTAMLQAAPLFQHRADILKALIESATNEGYRGFHDRRLALEMMGDYTPKSKLEVGKSVKGMEGMSDAELEAWAGGINSQDEQDEEDEEDGQDKTWSEERGEGIHRIRQDELEGEKNE